MEKSIKINKIFCRNKKRNSILNLVNLCIDTSMSRNLMSSFFTPSFDSEHETNRKLNKKEQKGKQIDALRGLRKQKNQI